MNFLNYDSPLVSSVNKLIDYIWLGLLWVVASIPIFTFGAATTAMYYTAEKRIYLHSGGIWQTFWSTFRKEFKQATIVWLIGLPIGISLALNALLIWKLPLDGIVYALLLATVLFGVGWMLLWYGYLSRFENTTRDVLFNTFRIALGNLPKLVLLCAVAAAAIAVAVFAFFYSFPFMVLVPGIYIALSNMILRSIFKPYTAEQNTSYTEE